MNNVIEFPSIYGNELLGIKSIRKYKTGYLVREEVLDQTKYGVQEPFTMKVAYTMNGDYIGDPKTAHFLCNKHSIKPQLISPKHKVCSIGFSEKDNKWYGWSHRAIYGFGIGSTVEYGDVAYIPKNREEYIESIKKEFNENDIL